MSYPQLIIFILCSLFSHANQSSYSLQNPFLQSPPYQACKPSKIIKLPKGNANDLIPPLADNSIRRLMVFEQIFLPNEQDEKTTQTIVAYGKTKLPKIILKLKQIGLLSEIKKTGKLYKINPVKILSPILVEMTFNGFLDQALQDNLSFINRQDLITKSNYLYSLLSVPKIKECITSSISNYWKWKCIDYFSSSHEGEHLATKLSGIKTYGISQFNPVLIWQLNDVVSKVSGLAKIEFGDFRSSLEAVLNPFTVVHYIAAYIKITEKIYKDVACFDISQNIGLSATLYNLGNEYERAFFSSAKYKSHQIIPSENYFGWFANYFESQIEQAL